MGYMRDSRNLLVDSPTILIVSLFRFDTVDALDDVGEHVLPVVRHNLRVGVAVEVEQAVEVEGALYEENF